MVLAGFWCRVFKVKIRSELFSPICPTAQVYAEQGRPHVWAVILASEDNMRCLNINCSRFVLRLDSLFWNVWMAPLVTAQWKFAICSSYVMEERDTPPCSAQWASPCPWGSLCPSSMDFQSCILCCVSVGLIDALGSSCVRNLWELGYSTGSTYTGNSSLPSLLRQSLLPRLLNHC